MLFRLSSIRANHSIFNVVIFGGPRVIFGNRRVIFGNLQKGSGHLRKSSEVFESTLESSEVFGQSS